MDPMSESPLHAFAGSRGPVAMVRVEDLKRVWSEIASMPPQSGICLDLIASMCEPDADAIAVWFRTSLVQQLLSWGRLKQWRSGNTLHDRVFEVAASFRFPNGPAAVNLDAFVAAVDQV